MCYTTGMTKNTLLAWSFYEDAIRSEARRIAATGQEVVVTLEIVDEIIYLAMEEKHQNGSDKVWTIRAAASNI